MASTINTPEYNSAIEEMNTALSLKNFNNNSEHNSGVLKINTASKPEGLQQIITPNAIRGTVNDEHHQA